MREEPHAGVSITEIADLLGASSRLAAELRVVERSQRATDRRLGSPRNAIAPKRSAQRAARGPKAGRAGKAGNARDELERKFEPVARSLAADDRARMIAAMDACAAALRKARERAECEIRPIRPADDRAMARVIRDVMTEHGASGPGFAIHDAEVGAMSKAYARPRHRFLVVTRRGKVIGGGGFAPLDGADRTTCELRKMYFRPEARGLGVGRELLSRLLGEMKKAGYRRCYLETLASMERARKLYVESGFEARCGPLGRTGHFACDMYYERAL